MANINGWGRGTWDEGAWGEALPVTLTGLAATSALGTLTFDAEANVTVASQLNFSFRYSTTVSNNNIRLIVLLCFRLYFTGYK
jgi:hypothetical protein